MTAWDAAAGASAPTDAAVTGPTDSAAIPVASAAASIVGTAVAVAASAAIATATGGGSSAHALPTYALAATRQTTRIATRGRERLAAGVADAVADVEKESRNAASSDKYPHRVPVSHFFLLFLSELSKRDMIFPLDLSTLVVDS